MRTFRGTGLMVVGLITTLFLASPAWAQTRPAAPPPPQQDTDQGVGIGALGGFAITSLRGSSEATEGTSSGTGPMFGIWFGGNRNGRVGFMGELNYVVSKVHYETFASTTGGEVTFNYLEIPALFRINIGSKSRDGVSVYGLVGPVFDFQLSKKIVEDGVEVPEAELENQFTSVNIGLMAGAGIEWNRIGFEVRGNWGMKQLATDEAIETGSVPDVKTTMLQFVGKFRFN